MINFIELTTLQPNLQPDNLSISLCFKKGCKVVGSEL